MNLLISDSTPIGAIERGHYVVQHGAHEFDLKDGTRHRYHFVAVGGLRNRWLRAVRLMDDESFAVFDLRHLQPQLAVELPGYLERDIPGLIKYSTRAVWGEGRELCRQIADVCLAVGKPVAMQ